MTGQLYRWILLGVASVTAMAATIVLPLRMLAPLRPAGGPLPGPTIPSERSQPAMFIPSTYRQGERVVMPVTFPDGSTAELVYPPELDLAAMGVRPYTSGCDRDFSFFYRYDPRGTWYGPDGPVAKYRGAGGSEVTLWEGRQGTDLYLRFQFHDWTVLMYDYANGLSESERAVCAQSLSGRQTDDGFIVLSMTEIPSRLTPLAGAGEHAGPELMFGELDPGFLLFPGRCQPSADDGIVDQSNGNPETFSSWCDREAGMTVHVYDDGDGELIEAIRAGLRFRNVRLAT